MNELEVDSQVASGIDMAEPGDTKTLLVVGKVVSAEGGGLKLNVTSVKPAPPEKPKAAKSAQPMEAPDDARIASAMYPA